VAAVTRSAAEIDAVFDRALRASHLGDRFERDDYAEGALATLQWITGQGDEPEFRTIEDYR